MASEPLPRCQIEADAFEVSHQSLVLCGNGRSRVRDSGQATELVPEGFPVSRLDLRSAIGSLLSALIPGVREESALRSGWSRHVPL